MPETGSKTAPVSSDTHIFPLKEFYAHAHLPLPQVEMVTGEQVPEPYKSLLVHNNDMTPTLESFHGGSIHLEVLRTERRGPFYFREVVLRMDKTETPVEFGAIKIHLAVFPEDAQALILEGYVPLGKILKDCDVQHRTEAKAFLRLQSDEVMSGAFELTIPVALYGRKAVISTQQGRPLAEIVEVLPPAAAKSS